jgi:hypothetical protein
LGELVSDDTSGDSEIAGVEVAEVAEVALSARRVGETTSVFREAEMLSPDVVELASFMDSVVATGSAIDDVEAMSSETVRIVLSTEEERGAREL